MDAAARRLAGAARLFAVDAARLGGLARLGLDAALGALQRFVTQVGQACPRISAVRLLGAKSAREDDQFAVGRHPAAREQLQPPPGFRRQTERKRVDAQLTGGGHLVYILSAHSPPRDATHSNPSY